MTSAAGLKTLEVYGDLQGSAFEAASSPRCVIFATKA
jgi:hypothetical protein